PAYLGTVASDVRGPCEENLGSRLREGHPDARRVFDVPRGVSPALEPGAHRHRRRADPALDDVEHVPSVIGEDAAASDGRIDAPVAGTLVPGQRGTRAQGVPDPSLDPTGPPP